MTRYLRTCTSATYVHYSQFTKLLTKTGEPSAQEIARRAFKGQRAGHSAPQLSCIL